MNKIEQVVQSIKPIDKKSYQNTQQRLDNLTKPLGSLGRLEEIAKQLVAITGKDVPPVSKKVVFTLAGDHGVTEDGVSAYPQSVTTQMIYNFIRGGAAINVLAKHAGAKVVVVDMGVKHNVILFQEPGENTSIFQDYEFKNLKISCGTNNFTKGPAMTQEQAIQSIETGINLVEEELEKGLDIAIPGDMGIGNTTSASAITAVITQVPIERVVGKGTGITDDAVLHKRKVVVKAISLNKPDSSNAIDVLSKVGGFEIGGLTGIILCCAAHRIPVIIDGFISGSAALLASLFNNAVEEYLIAGHCSQEPGHIVQLNRLGLRPILDLDMRLGEGTGGVLASTIVEASQKILTQMATFTSAGVDKKI